MWVGIPSRVTSVTSPGSVSGCPSATERNSFGRRAGSQQVGGREWLIFGIRPQLVPSRRGISGPGGDAARSEAVEIPKGVGLYLQRDNPFLPGGSHK